MRPLSLTPRLLAIAERIPKGARVADIGTDHARLPVYLCEQNITNKVIASDISEGPLERAACTIAAHKLTDVIDVVQCNGVAGISPDSVDVVVIAGMGGDTIAGILRESTWLNSKLLILQPMTHAERVLETLDSLKSTVREQVQVREGHRSYTIIFAGDNNNDSGF